MPHHKKLSVSYHCQITIPCSSFSHTNWTFNTGPISKNVKLKNNSLFIRKAGFKNSGIYKCEGTDEKQNRFLSVFVLYVEGEIIGVIVIFIYYCI